MNRFEFTHGRIITYPIEDDVILKIRNIDYESNEVTFCDKNDENITKNIQNNILITNQYGNIQKMTCIPSYILDWNENFGDFNEIEYKISYKGELVFTLKPHREWLIEYHKKDVSIKKVKIEAQLETSDHDGYCTDNECDYNTEIVVHYVDVPKEYQDHSLGPIDQDGYDWKSLLPNPGVEGNSCYCSLCQECIDAGLDIHDYRYTIQSVELVEK
jgi:hypothetical protein